MKSRIVRILPNMGTVKVAEELNRIVPLIPTLGYCDEPFAGR